MAGQSLTDLLVVGSGASLSQHPIIFGKSKDSILVFEQQEGGEQFKPGNEQQRADGGFTPIAATTRVLTDDKGHSIKIRIASPPPQRQTQLAKLNREREQLKQQRSNSIGGLSQSSECPLVGTCEPIASGRDSLLRQSSQENGNVFSNSGYRSPEATKRTRRRQQQRQRWAESGNEGEEEEGEGGVFEADGEESGGRVGVGAGCGRSQTPIEAFNDSNTSEFDDGCWDSRQDTSLDFVAANLEPIAEGVRAESRNLEDWSMSNDDHVMDADLRHTNRLNLELLVLQNAAQSMLGAALADQANQVKSGWWSRSKSIGGPAQAGFSQSGILTAASEFPQHQQCSTSDQFAAMRDQMRSGTVSKSRTSSENDSGVAGLLDSRKSSLNGGPFGQCPSIRLRVRPVNKRGENQQGESLVGEEAAASTTRSLLSTLGSIGRSRTLPEAEEAGEQMYELQLIEVRNVSPRNQRANSVANPIPGFGQSTGGEGARRGGRRESLLGSLVNSATGNSNHSSGRRHSVEGVFVRVFKHQSEQQASSSSVAASEQRPYDTMSLHSSGSEHLQLPLVKPTLGGDCVNFEELAPAGSYGLVCAASEFPLRISLYQVGKRGSARYTLGHCFLLPQHWQPSGRPNESEQPETGEACQAATKRHSSGSQASEVSGGLRDGRKFVQVGSDDSSSGELHVEYKLFQTILEAIK